MRGTWVKLVFGWRAKLPAALKRAVVRKIFSNMKNFLWLRYKTKLSRKSGKAKNLEVAKMAVKIRLKRMGAKKSPFYRVVVADSRYPRDGRFIEEIGTYNPLTDPSTINIDGEKAKKWMANGAQPTDTVKGLLKKTGIL